MKETRKLWWGLGILILISPVGLILPEMFKSGPAYGEWNLEEVERMLGFIPEGLRIVADLWAAPIPDYNLRSWEGKGMAVSSLGYVLSGILGVGVIVLGASLLGKILGKKNHR